MRLPAAWMGVGLWCLFSTEIPTEQVMGMGSGFQGHVGILMYTEMHLR